MSAAKSWNFLDYPHANNNNRPGPGQRRNREANNSPFDALLSSNLPQDRPLLEVIQQQAEDDEGYLGFLQNLKSDVEDLFWLVEPKQFGKNHMGVCIVEKAAEPKQIAGILAFYDISLARPNVLQEQPGLHHILVKGAWRPKYAQQLQSFMGAFVLNIFGKSVPHPLVASFFPGTLTSVKFWVQHPSSHSSYSVVAEAPPPMEQLLFVEGVLEGFSSKLFREQRDPEDPLASFQVEATPEEVEKLKEVPLSRPGVKRPEKFYAVQYDVDVKKNQRLDCKLEACAKHYAFLHKQFKESHEKMVTDAHANGS